jgi:hypothetical protein
MNIGYGLGFFLFSVMWGLLLYQLGAGKLLDRNWKVWTTRKERPALYWTVVLVQAVGILLGSVFFIRDVLSLK